MLKNISKLGKTLSKLEQKEVNGGGKCCNPTYQCCAHCPGEIPGCDWVHSNHCY